MSTFDSTVKIDRASMDALLARDSLDIIEFEDAIAADDTQWEPIQQRRGNVVTYLGAAARSVLAHHVTIHEVDTLSATWTKANSFRVSKNEVPARPIQWSSSNHLGMAQKLVRELGRLKDGWAGPDTVAPSSNILRDIQLVAGSLPSFTRAPDTEVDPDDGSVVLRWINGDASCSFTLTFVGQGGVTGFYSADNSSSPAWKLKASDSIRLAIKFNTDHVQTLLIP